MGTVLNDLAIEVEDGDIIAVLGRNGAGKTTLLETIAGLLKPQAGTVTVDGIEITGKRASAIARLGIALVPEGRRLFPSMTVQENLALGAHAEKWWLHGPKADSYSAVWDVFPPLYEFRKSKVGGLSGGQQQMVAVGRALMSRPRVLLLDEPTFGLSPQLTDSMCSQLKGLGGKGIAVLLAEQNVDVGTDVADTVALLADGNIQSVCPSSTVHETSVFREAMFGVG
jgi:branched-chain amino acid transport system ATP-binding protein